MFSLICSYSCAGSCFSSYCKTSRNTANLPCTCFTHTHTHARTHTHTHAHTHTRTHTRAHVPDTHLHHSLSALLHLELHLWSLVSEAFLSYIPHLLVCRLPPHSSLHCLSYKGALHTKKIWISCLSIFSHFTFCPAACLPSSGRGAEVITPRATQLMGKVSHWLRAQLNLNIIR